MSFFGWLTGVTSDKEFNRYVEELKVQRERDREIRKFVLDEDGGIEELERMLSGYTTLEVKTACFAMCKEIIRLKKRIELLENK